MKKTRYLLTLAFLLLTLAAGACSGAIAPAQNAEEPSTAAQAATEGFTLSSPAVAEGDALPAEYTCDGPQATLALNWSGAPAGTQSYAVIMHHVAGPEDIHWYWVLYDIPAGVTSLARNSTGVGTLGTNSVNDQIAYAGPCSQGPGEKAYTYTVYALLAEPQLSVPASQVTRAVLLDAIQDSTLASAELHVVYTRPAAAVGDAPPEAVSPTGAPGPNAGQSPDGRTPPAEAIAACSGKGEQAACEFTSPRGTETGVCEMVQEQLACSPPRGQAGGTQPGSGGGQPSGNGATGDAAGYNIDQAISDKAQGMTIAFDALAFLTGDLGADSFFPPARWPTSGAFNSCATTIRARWATLATF